MKRLFIVGALLAVALAAVVSLFASSAPDGLERVARDHGIAAAEKQSASAGSPLAGYTVRGVGERTGGAAAGVAGLAVTAAAGFGLFHLLKGRRS